MTSDGAETHCILFDTRDKSHRRIARSELAAYRDHEDCFVWVDIHSSDISSLAEAAADLGVDVPSIHHFDAPEILPRLVEAADHLSFYMYEVRHPARHLDTKSTLCEIEFVRLQVVLARHAVLTFHRSPNEAVEDVLAGCGANFKLAGETPAFVLFLLLEESLYDIAHLNLANDNYLDLLVRRVIEPGDTNLPPDVTIAGSNILTLKKLATSLHIVLMRLATKRSPFMSAAATHSLLVMMENALAVRETIDSSRDMLDGVFTAIQTEAANRTSEIARVLTVMSGVLLPVAIVAGIFGMNFKIMPETQWDYGYPAALGLMAAIAGVQFVIFRRLGWIGHPKQLGGD